MIARLLTHYDPQTHNQMLAHQRDPDTISRAYLKCIQNDPELIRALVNK
jgi:hypothetical protein